MNLATKGFDEPQEVQVGVFTPPLPRRVSSLDLIPE